MPVHRFTLRCPECRAEYSPWAPQSTCTCGSPVLAQYDVERATHGLSRDDLQGRIASLWRYRELLPVHREENIVSLGEGFTPLIRAAALGEALGLKNLYLKLEGINPTGTFKARGSSVGVSALKELGVRELVIRSAGSAGAAWSTYAARAGLGIHVFMSESAPSLARKECYIVGARVVLMRPPFGRYDAAIAAARERHGWFDVTAMRQPYRVEGKKTLLYEIAEQMAWDLPEVIVHPTGGGVGLIAMDKAYDELTAAGWLSAPRPRFVAAQSAGCAPIVTALQAGKDRCDPWQDPRTMASGILVPNVLAGRIILRLLRRCGGTAVAVSEEEIRRTLSLVAAREGLFVGPEAAAAVAAVGQMRQRGELDPDERVVCIVTATGLRFPEVVDEQLAVLEPEQIAGAG